MEVKQALRHKVGFLGCPVEGQELDSMIPLGPFQGYSMTFAGSCWYFRFI